MLAPNTISAFMRVLAVLAAGGLAACAESNTQDAGALAAAPPTAPRPTPAGRNTTPPPVAPPVVAAAPGMTVERARAECWMKFESDKKAPRDLDKRVKLVEACTDEKMKAQPTPPAQ